MTEAHKEQAVTVWVYLAAKRNYEPFINDRFVPHPGLLPQKPINISLWWSFLFRNNTSYLVNEREIQVAYDTFRSIPNNPALTLKKTAVTTLADTLQEFSEVKKLEITDTRMFSFPRSLETLINVIDLRLDHNSLSYVCLWEGYGI